MRRRFTRPLAFAAGVALSVGAVAFATAPSQADEPPQLIKLSLEPGYILLDTSTNTVTSTSSTDEQSIVVGCSLDDVLEPADSLLVVNPLPRNTSLGYGKNGIGVSGKKDKNGTRCADVDDEYGQALEVKAATGVGPFTAADLDIEFKGGTDLDLEVFMGTTQLTDVDDYTVTGGPGDASDNGPDSADGDNRRILITALGGQTFDRLVLTPTNGGALSLEGGGDGTSASTLVPTTSASVFQFDTSEGSLPCDVDPEGEPGVTENGVTVYFTNCETGTSVPYFLDRPEGTNQVTFAVPNSADNAYRVEIEWEPETATLPVPANSKVAYFRFADGSLKEEPLTQCGGTVGAPYLKSDVLPDVEGNQGFCISGQSWRLGDQDTKMVVTEYLFGVGDPAFGRAN